MVHNVFKMGVLLSLFAGTLSLSEATSRRPVIYGEDGRMERRDVVNSLLQDSARSTAAMVKKEFMLSRDNGNNFELTGDPFSQRVCAEERFTQQKAAAFCSGFLIAPQILMTAGHCVRDVVSCADFMWVFDYQLDEGQEQNDATVVSASNVYRCTRIISQNLDKVTMQDYSIIQLDRPVHDRDPLRMRREGKMDNNADLVVIGHPSGLPSKVTMGAHPRDNTKDIFFVMNSDTFTGNSGSAVLDAHTGLVEGILVRGERDFEMDFSRSCMTVKRCEGGNCRGEDATRVTSISALDSIIAD